MSALITVATIVILEVAFHLVEPAFAYGIALGGLLMAIVALWEAGGQKRTDSPTQAQETER